MSTKSSLYFFMHRLFIVIIFAAMSASCVPNKKVVYLQDKLKDEIILDSVMNKYTVHDFEYQLQPKDILSIRVSSLTPAEYNFFRETEQELGDPLLSGYLIDEEGFIEIPAVGKIELNNLTIREAENKLQSALKSFLQNPVVRIKMLNFEVTILGEVSRPGAYSSFQSKLSLFDAIALAGDLTELADRSQIKIIRYNGNQASMVYVNTLEDKFLESNYFYLRPHDLIIVAPLDVKNIRQYQIPTIGILLSTVSAITFFIVRLTR